MNRVLEYTGKQNILEVWPEMELFVHGGMNFNPYREQYRRIFPVRHDEVHGDLQRFRRAFFSLFRTILLVTTCC